MRLDDARALVAGAGGPAKDGAPERTVHRLLKEIRSLNPDVLHAHGAKGGAYARIIGTLLRASGSRVARIHTPHGGSLHYDPRSPGPMPQWATLSDLFPVAVPAA